RSQLAPPSLDLQISSLSVTTYTTLVLLGAIATSPALRGKARRCQVSPPSIEAMSAPRSETKTISSTALTAPAGTSRNDSQPLPPSRERAIPSIVEASSTSPEMDLAAASDIIELGA